MKSAVLTDTVVGVFLSSESCPPRVHLRPDTLLLELLGTHAWSCVQFLPDSMVVL